MIHQAPAQEMHYIVTSHKTNHEDYHYALSHCRKDMLRNLDEAIAQLEFLVQFEGNDVPTYLLDDLLTLRADIAYSTKHMRKEKCFPVKPGKPKPPEKK